MKHLTSGVPNVCSPYCPACRKQFGDMWLEMNRNRAKEVKEFMKKVDKRKKRG